MIEMSDLFATLYAVDAETLSLVVQEASRILAEKKAVRAPREGLQAPTQGAIRLGAASKSSS